MYYVTKQKTSSWSDIKIAMKKNRSKCLVYLTDDDLKGLLELREEEEEEVSDELFDIIAEQLSKQLIEIFPEQLELACSSALMIIEDKRR